MKHTQATTEPPKKDHLVYAHERAIEIAGKSADPILNPGTFNHLYWVVMGGFGFRPYP